MINETMKVSYYPGCSLEGTAKSYNTTTKQVCESLGIGIEEVTDWACCGSSPALKTDRLLSVCLSAHNLALIEKQRLTDVLVPCPFCFRRLLSAQQDIKQDKKLEDQVRETILSDIQGKLNIHNLLGFLRYQVGLDEIRSHVKMPLKGLKVLPYYGCYLVKPGQVTHFDDPEHPTSMDDILKVLGATVPDWDFKTECCGAGLSLSKTDKVRELSGRIIQEALWRKADALVVGCQLCQANLDMRQQPVNPQQKKSKKGTHLSGLFDEIEVLKSAHREPGAPFGKLPILYFTQLMGLAFGFNPKDLGLKQHLVNPLPMLKEKSFVE